MFPDLKTIVILESITWTPKDWKDLIEAWYNEFREDGNCRNSMKHPFPKLEHHERAIQVYE